MIDLHTHTTASDGVLSPSELVVLSVKSGVRLLAVTDHDTISGIEEAEIAAGDYRLDFIPGVELSTTIAGNEVHILGYFIDHKNPGLNEKLEALQKNRESRVDKILEKLEKFNLNPGFENVRKFSSGNSPGRPHIARAMIEAGFVKDIKEAFDTYLKKGSPCYVPRKKFTPEDSVSLIKEAGGLPVLAHPGLLENFELVFNYLLKSGIQGIECYYPEHSPEKTDYFVKLAQEKGLVVTGGSDYHGPKGKTKVNTPGMPNIPREIVSDLKKIYRDKKKN